MENPFTVESEGSSDGEGGKGSSPDSLASASPNLGYAEIARKLLRDRLYLTALELHAELIEAGKEIPRLREFFSNPANFENQLRPDISPSIPRSSSQATLDSLDFTRFSEDGERGVDERVAVLEFELRKAKETINALRADLTVAAESETQSVGDGKEGKKPGGCDTIIKPHEQRALNFLINEYLLVRGYKLTSITFADENEDQDFEDWDDVGLNMSKPAELLHLYRCGMRQHSALDTSEASTQTEEPLEEPQNMVDETEELFQRIERLEMENSSLSESLEGFRKKADVELLDASTQSEVYETSEINPTKIDNNAKAKIDQPDFGEPKKESPIREIINSLQKTEIRNNNHFLFSKGFESKVWSELTELSSLEGLDTISSETLILCLGECLPRIVQNFQFTKKELMDEMVVLIVCLIYLHPNAYNQESLLYCLVNMKKRPQEEERNLIIAGLVKIAEVCKEEVVQGQLLPQFWELLTHKYPEKRLLIAKAFAYIAPYISSELRDSLLVSMLQQLILEDREETVKEAGITSLAVITSVIKEPDKFAQLKDIMLKGLDDPSEIVVNATLTLLLPVMARWALQLNRFHSQLIVEVISTLSKHIKEGRETKSVRFLNALTSLLPHLVMFAATSPDVLAEVKPNLLPAHSRAGFSDLCQGLSNPVVFNSDEAHSVGAVMAAFDHCVHCLKSWPQLSWILDEMLPSLLKLLNEVDVTHEGTILAFIRFFRSFSAGFGEELIVQRVKPLFEEKLQLLEKDLMEVRQDWPSLGLWPVYAVAILAHSQVEELKTVLEHMLVALSLCGAPLEALRLTVRELCKNQELVDSVITPIWQGVVHQRAIVRSVTGQILEEVVQHCSESVTNNSVIPALVTLASDPDISVRVSTLSTFALVIERSTNKEVLDKSYLQVQCIVSDGSVKENHSTLLAVINILGKMAPYSDPSFREEVIVGELGGCVISDLARRPDITEALVEAYSNTIYSQISTLTITNVLLPALRLLENLCNESLLTHMETVSSMIREIESRVEPIKPVPRSSSSMSLGMTPSNVEDMKQRVSKIFTSPRPANLPNLPNLFKKK